jgi:Flp pilus assembly protein TadG
MRLVRDRRGSVALMAAVVALPVTMAAGMALDYSRAVTLRSELQELVSNSALAGASSYVSDSAQTIAASTALMYAQAIHLDGFTVAGTPVVSAAPGTENGQTGYIVTVTVTYQLQNTFMSMVQANTQIQVTATAFNPILIPMFGTSKFSSSAADGNALYTYVVPTGSNGKPNYTYTPVSTDLYEVDSNCTKAYGDGNYTASSLCNSVQGYKMPTSQTPLQVSSTTPIAFALQNLTGGLVSYGTNGYGSTAGSQNWFYSGYLTGGYAADYTNNRTTGTGHNKVTTKYPTTANCSLEVVDVTGMTTLPANPAISGSCLSLPTAGDTTGMYTITCSQLHGRTLAYYWNDMGGGKDDLDYNDAVMTVSCTGGGNGLFGNGVISGVSEPVLVK